MQIDKSSIFNNDKNVGTDAERHFVLVVGAERHNEPGWIKESILTELMGFESKYDIPKDKNAFVLLTLPGDNKLNDVDNAVIQTAVDNELDYAVLTLDDPKSIAQFLHKHCSCCLVFGQPGQDAFLARVVLDMERVQKPYTIYDEDAF